MIKKIIVTFSVILLLFLVGCSNSSLTPTSTAKVIHKGVVYEIVPYTSKMHELYQYDPLFSQLSFGTAFLVRINNLNNYPIQTLIKDTFTLQDSNKIQYKPISDPYTYIKNSNQYNEFSDLSHSELKNIDIELSYMENQEITTINADYYQTQLSDLRKKIHTIEKNQLLSQELEQRRAEFKNKLEIYGFKDQIIYPEGISVGIIIFPPIPTQYLTDTAVYFILPGEKVASISFTLKTNSN